MVLSFILLFLIIVLLIILSMVWPPDSPWAPWWRTSKKTARAMCKLANVRTEDIVYDLGSGDGTSLIVAAREFGATSVGIEIDPLRFFISKILIRYYNLSKKIKVYRKNFFNIDISDASVIFLYLVPKALMRLKPKLLKELKPGTKVVTVTYPIPGGLTGKEEDKHLKPLGVKESLVLYNPLKKDERKIFLYIVPEKKK
ncbi:MAG: 50S ribosomal protein L11 methyltransferase [Candidatus Levybacteria bacterium]|nr:50S ribosomal protein L11 methyltransferase [Candidatus Levybacteria bacterium]